MAADSMTNPFGDSPLHLANAGATGFPTEVSPDDLVEIREVKERFRESVRPGQSKTARPKAPPITLLGIPFDNVTTAETIDLIEEMVASGKPHYLATANVDFLVQAVHDVELRRILLDAHMVLCDGTPLVWASRLLGNPLPERVAGSDLVPLLLRIAAEKKHRVFFLGGTPEATSRAVSNLHEQYPELIIAGHYSPPFARLLEMDHVEINQRIQEARPDLLFVSFGCPKQEKWISMHHRSLGVPVSVGVGATIDFLAGTAARAPRWMQQTGLEWVFRLLQEPRRLFKRYVADLWWFSQLIVLQWWCMQFRPTVRKEGKPVTTWPEQKWQRVHLPERLDVEAVRRDSADCEEALLTSKNLLLDLSRVKFVDSTGIGLLVRLHKKARITGGHLILLAPSRAMERALRLMRLRDFFLSAKDLAAAESLLARTTATETVLHQPNYYHWKPFLYWRGEVTSANAEEVWNATEKHLLARRVTKDRLVIDLSSLQFIDSTGVGLMIRAKKKAADMGLKLAFSSPQPNVKNVLKISNLEKVLLT